MPRGGRGSVIAPVRIPTSGWDAISPITAVPADRAITLVNLIPQQGGIEVREGYDTWVFELLHNLTPDNVESLLVWNGPSSKKMFAALGGKIYEVTASGDYTAISSDISGLTNDRWQQTMFATSGGNFLVIANGEDAVRNYNGTTWTAPTITGATSTNLISVTAHQRRLWFVEEDTTKAWYLPVESIAGAASLFDLGPLFKNGGSLQAIGSWSVDGGAGQDDHLVFISTKGEAVVYVGTDPSSSSTWGMVGIFEIGTPIGRRCITKFGGDLVVLTVEGIVSLSAILNVGREQGDRANIAYNIGNAHTSATALYSGNFGWEITSFPERHLVIVNIPTGGANSFQHVINTLTGAWCKFTGINTLCWKTFGSFIFFGGNTVVRKGFDSRGDLGANIMWECQTAFTGLKHPSMQKHVRMTRLTLETEAGYFPTVGIDVDYTIKEPALGADEAPVGADVWDTGTWDAAVWGGGTSVPRAQWIGAAAIGYAISPHIKGATKSISAKITALDLLYEAGGPL